MRRTRAALTAWPAFADLMTILAVVGLTAAIVIATQAGERIALLEKRITTLTEINSILQDGLRARDEQIKSLENTVRDLKDRLRAPDEEAEGEATIRDLEATIRDLEATIRDLRERIRFGALPCLREQGEPFQPRTLLRIVVNDGGYYLELLLEDDQVASDIPRLREAVSRGQLEPATFELFAGAMYRHGDADDTFGRSCRFFVELKKGPNSRRRFGPAAAVVERYFLIANSSEVIALRAAEG